jgi:hypothetical protein
LRRSNRTPSIVRRGDDQDVYLVVDDLDRLGRVWREADYGTTDWETMITDLLAGEYKNPIGVIALNSAEGWARDMSADAAVEIRKRCNLQHRDVPSVLQDFVDHHDALDHSQLLFRCAWCDREMHPL